MLFVTVYALVISLHRICWSLQILPLSIFSLALLTSWKLIVSELCIISSVISLYSLRLSGMTHVIDGYCITSFSPHELSGKSNFYINRLCFCFFLQPSLLSLLWNQFLCREKWRCRDTSCNSTTVTEQQEFRRPERCHSWSVGSCDNNFTKY